MTLQPSSQGAAAAAGVQCISAASISAAPSSQEETSKCSKGAKKKRKKAAAAAAAAAGANGASSHPASPTATDPPPAEVVPSASPAGGAAAAAAAAGLTAEKSALRHPPERGKLDAGLRPQLSQQTGPPQKLCPQQHHADGHGRGTDGESDSEWADCAATAPCVLLLEAHPPLSPAASSPSLHSALSASAAGSAAGGSRSLTPASSSGLLSHEQSPTLTLPPPLPSPSGSASHLPPAAEAIEPPPPVLGHQPSCQLASCNPGGTASQQKAVRKLGANTNGDPGSATAVGSLMLQSGKQPASIQSLQHKAQPQGKVSKKKAAADTADSGCSTLCSTSAAYPPGSGGPPRQRKTPGAATMPSLPGQTSAPCAPLSTSPQQNGSAKTPSAAGKAPHSKAAKKAAAPAKNPNNMSTAELARHLQEEQWPAPGQQRRSDAKKHAAGDAAAGKATASRGGWLSSWLT